MSTPISEIVAGIIKPAVDIIDEFKFSGEEKAQWMGVLKQIEQNALGAVLDYENKVLDVRSKIIIEEAKGENWLQRNWRPALMATMMFILAWNYAAAPILTWISGLWDGPALVVLEFPVDFWDTLKIGLGGYIVGRSGE
jgi:hypothetical protein